jgi:predicted ester cyclase
VFVPRVPFPSNSSYTDVDTHVSTRSGKREEGGVDLSAEENREKARRLLEESLGGGKLELVDDLFDSDFVRYDPYIATGEVRGAQTVKENIVWFRSAFRDLSCTVEEQVAEGDKVVSRWTLGGTHQGEFFGVGGTGNRVEFTGIQIDRFDEESGKIIEERAEFDLLGAMRQMGAIPE